MELYFRREGITLYHGEVRYMADILPTESIDCIIADPPYGETSLEWDQWPGGWLEYTKGVLKPSGSLWCFGTLKMFWKYQEEFSGWKLVQDIIWEKHNGSGFSTDRFRRVHEQVAQFIREDVTWSEVYKDVQTTPTSRKRRVSREATTAHWHGGQGPTEYEREEGGPLQVRSVIYSRSCHHVGTHPTQKPLDILVPLIEYSCAPGATVLDPFSGSGAVIRACQQTGRNVIAFEASEAYCAQIVQTLQSCLF